MHTACSMSLSLEVRGKLDASKKWYKAVLGPTSRFLDGENMLILQRNGEIDVEIISAGNGELKGGRVF